MSLTPWCHAGYAVRAHTKINNNHKKCARELVYKFPGLMNIICYTILFNSGGNYNLLVKILNFNLLKKNLTLLVISMCLSSLFSCFKHKIPLRGT